MKTKAKLIKNLNTLYVICLVFWTPKLYVDLIVILDHLVSLCFVRPSFHFACYVGPKLWA